MLLHVRLRQIAGWMGVSSVAMAAIALVGWMRTLIEVPHWHKAAAQGTTHYANLERSQALSELVEGTVLEVSDAELAASDGYENDAGYQRLMITLASGRSAWVYVSAQGIPSKIEPSSQGD